MIWAVPLTTPACRDGAHQRAVSEEVGVEVALPVVPELVGVRLERRHPDVGAGERGLGLARVEVRRVVDVDEDRARDAEVGEDATVTIVAPAAATRPPSRSGAARSTRRPGAASEDCGACAARAKMSITSPALSGSGSVRWKALPSSPSTWAMWSIASSDEVDGDDVDLAAPRCRASASTAARRCGSGGSA